MSELDGELTAMTESHQHVRVSEADEVTDLESAREKIAQLETALQSRIVIEQAKGTLAERLGIDVDQAFGILRHAARSHRLKLHDVAARVVNERTTPSPVVVAIARESRMRGAWMRERAEAQRKRLEELTAQINEQVRLANDRYRRD
jgi:ANTAR domain-containing protein